MTDQQTEAMTTILLTLCGGGGWVFLLYNLYFAFNVPGMS